MPSAALRIGLSRTGPVQVQRAVTGGMKKTTIEMMDKK
jgi:hypothetical protein